MVILVTVIMVMLQWSYAKPVIKASFIIFWCIDLVMTPHKYSKTEMHRVLAKVLRNAAAKIQRKKTKKMKKAKLQAIAMMRKTWQILSNLCNLCLLFSYEKETS